MWHSNRKVIYIPRLFLLQAWLETTVPKTAHSIAGSARHSLSTLFPSNTHKHIPPFLNCQYPFCFGRSWIQFQAKAPPAPALDWYLRTTYRNFPLSPEIEQCCPWGLIGSAGEVASINYSTKKPLECSIVKFVLKIILLLKITIHYAS